MPAKAGPIDAPRNRTFTFIILALSLGVLSIYTISHGIPIVTTPASATTNATQEDTSSVNQTAEDYTNRRSLRSRNTKACNSWSAIKS